MSQNGDKDDHNARRPNPVDTHVGSRVRFQRMVKKMSQGELGDRLGLTFQQVQKYERGANRISASRLFGLSQVLEVPVQFFYDKFDSPAAEFAEETTGDYVAGFVGTKEGLELNMAFVNIVDPKVRRLVIELVKSLSGRAEKSSGGDKED